MRVYTPGVLCLIAVSAPLMAREATGAPSLTPVLHAKFTYADTPPSTDKDGQKVSRYDGELLTSVAVDLAGKVAESLIDAAAARTQPEAVVLDTVVPLDGFYGPNGSIAAHGGTLTFHNGVDDKCREATLCATFRLLASPDGSAFRFSVDAWKFDRFLKGHRTQWFQTDTYRDIALKIEFLTPGNASLGTRAAFIEHVFPAVHANALPSLFIKNQELPWFAAPPRPDSRKDAGRVLPLNLRVTLVQTSRTNQMGLWVRALAKENREAVSSAVQESVRRTLDPAYQAAEQITQTEAANAAFAGYAVAWNALSTHHLAKPHNGDPATMTAWRADFTIRHQVMESRRAIARAAYSTAGLTWPGNFPDLSAN